MDFEFLGGAWLVDSNNSNPNPNHIRSLVNYLHTRLLRLPFGPRYMGTLSICHSINLDLTKNGEGIDWNLVVGIFLSQVQLRVFQ